ncbi:MAG: hypothetical protein KC652_03050 [Cyanobacteria bacterium HKST-UBA01]|nr:hypothetical protein [Cyanobacteria bacterium HKST-UBA01]
MDSAGECQSLTRVEYKVKFAYKLATFAGAVLGLSWFFEGWRAMQDSFTLEHFGILLFGTLVTVFFVGVHAYWIYLEEKAKGTLKKHIGLFERISAFSTRDAGDKAVGKGEGLKRG